LDLLDSLPGFIPSLFWGIITISILVFIHEAGHYLAARLLGLKVTEFFIGLPGPNLSFKRGGTTFGITAIPLGGYVRIPALEGSGPGAELGSMSEEERKEYDKIPAWKRITVLLAGAFANLLVAVVVLTALFTFSGVPTETGHVSPVEGGPAAVAGLPENSQIADIDGVEIEDFAHLTGIISGHEPGDTIRLTYVSDEGDRNTIIITLEERPAPEGSPDHQEEEQAEDSAATDSAAAEPPPSPVWMGVAPHIELEQMGIFNAFTYSFTYIGLTIEGIARFFSPNTFQEALGDASSIIGISVFSAHAASMGFLPYASMIALISIALGLMNLLPIPPLDGGKIVFEVIQLIIRRPVPQSLQLGITLTGFALIIVLMLYLMGQDLFRIFS
ncbi:MAG: M50 family metallopeptidase, partial [Coriobacteriia bacterium]|nr:M50 family metallopeptidase [Coriobacteriia bacterium]